MKPTQQGSEIAAALIAVAANEGNKNVDSFLSLYFEALSKIMNSAADENWPHIASWARK